MTQSQLAHVPLPVSYSNMPAGICGKRYIYSFVLYKVVEIQSNKESDFSSRAATESVLYQAHGFMMGINFLTSEISHYSARVHLMR